MTKLLEKLYLKLHAYNNNLLKELKVKSQELIDTIEELEE